jgi:hypothetical protein
VSNAALNTGCSAGLPFGQTAIGTLQGAIHRIGERANPHYLTAVTHRKPSMGDRSASQCRFISRFSRITSL